MAEAERPQSGFLLLHLRNVSQVPFTHLCSRLLLVIRQDLSCLMDEIVRTLQRGPEAGCCLEPFHKELVELLQGWGQSFFPWTRSIESLICLMRSCNLRPDESSGERPSSVREARTARQ